MEGYIDFLINGFLNVYTKDTSTNGEIFLKLFGENGAHSGRFLKKSITDKTLFEEGKTDYFELKTQSILRPIWVYNQVPDTVLAARSVSLFHHNLQLLWKELLSN